MAKFLKEELSCKISKEDIISELGALGYRICSILPRSYRFSDSYYRVEARKEPYHLIVYVNENKQILQLHKDVGRPHRMIVTRDTKEELERIKGRLEKYKS